MFYYSCGFPLYWLYRFVRFLGITSTLTRTCHKTQRRKGVLPMENTNKPPDYNGKRALMLLRVSTAIQEEMYGWPSQERSVREKLLEPLSLRLVKTIKDTYTGLEFRERKALEEILRMAQGKEFDVLVMDVLDRLGRKGLLREIYRMQLREFGIHVLTTDPNDHADDDTLMGEMTRLIRGYVAEEELNNIRRRTMNGRRERAEEGKLLGASTPLYGFMYPITEQGVDRTRYILNDVVFYVDTSGYEWTEVKVVLFFFEGVVQGRTIRGMATELIEREVKTRKGKDWCISTISNILRNPFYYGKGYVFKERLLEERMPGKNRKKRERRPLDERIWLPDGVVPAIITQELFEQTQGVLRQNQENASRNNAHPEESLLRAGLAKCGYCGSNLTVHHTKDRPDRHEKATAYYYCSLARNRVRTPCKHHATLTRILDDTAWQAALEIIANPKLVDEQVQARRTQDPTAGRRKQITTKLAEIRRDQTAMRKNLSDLIRKKQVDAGTQTFLTSQLKELAEQETRNLDLLSQEENLQEKWRQVEEKITELHQFCAEMREKLDDPTYIPPFKKKREILKFFGITAILWGTDHEPRYKIEANPPSIVSTLSL
jgi:site-specific DNA recombinase